MLESWPSVQKVESVRCWDSSKRQIWVPGIQSFQSFQTNSRWHDVFLRHITHDIHKESDSTYVCVMSDEMKDNCFRLSHVHTAENRNPSLFHLLAEDHIWFAAHDKSNRYEGRTGKTRRGTDGMLELAYSIVTVPGTKCQTHTPNKVTRDEALWGIEAVLSCAVVAGAPQRVQLSAEASPPSVESELRRQSRIRARASKTGFPSSPNTAQK